ncbi:MAG: hypothetical protein LC650_05260 [Actinobacteria bacterium]|nr:hypothetical protein [Actinomycetota bacterium]
MAQGEIIAWLVMQRRARPAAVFTNADIARGVGSNAANTLRSLEGLAKHGQVECVEVNGERRRCYRASVDAFVKVTGLDAAILEEGVVPSA